MRISRKSERFVKRNIVVTQRALDRLASLREKTDAIDDSEVFRNAIALYDKFVDVIRADGRIQLVAPDGTVRQLDLISVSKN